MGVEVINSHFFVIYYKMNGSSLLKGLKIGKEYKNMQTTSIEGRNIMVGIVLSTTTALNRHRPLFLDTKQMNLAQEKQVSPRDTSNKQKWDPRSSTNLEQRQRNLI